jgi:uridine kinase
LCFLLAKAVRELYPRAHFSVDHSFGLGLYCSYRKGDDESKGITVGELGQVERRMRELVERGIPIVRRKIAFTEAVQEFERSGQQDKLNLLKFRNPPRVVIHWCDGFSDLAHGPLAPDTGVLTRFKLIHYPPGFVLHLPDRESPHGLPPFEDQPHMFNIFQEHKEWGRILGVTTVGRLNEIVAAGEIDAFIRTAEALHEKKLARIADQISASRPRPRLILIAGPSCAGKTTFAKRLETHLMVNGMRTASLSADDFFVGAEENPRDETGRPDYEHIEAVDLELLNDQLVRLLDGEEIEPPRYDFAARRSVAGRERLHVAPDQVVIMEGIHALNPRLTHRVPEACKFKIYISALTQLNVDSHNRISTTDNRLMRRIVRDHSYRGHPALETLQLWPNVRRGEKRWIFPFQREADATFNSALDYELAVLKPLVEPLLMQVKPSDPEYAEARRLTELLLNFLATSDRPVPGTSILREYISGSVFRY